MNSKEYILGAGPPSEGFPPFDFFLFVSAGRKQTNTVPLYPSAGVYVITCTGAASPAM